MYILYQVNKSTVQNVVILEAWGGRLSFQDRPFQICFIDSLCLSNVEVVVT